MATIERSAAPGGAGEALAQGWGWPINSRKAHYDLAGEIVSVCGRWMYSGQRADVLHDSPDNCAACRKQRERRAGAGAGGEA